MKSLLNEFLMHIDNVRKRIFPMVVNHKAIANDFNSIRKLEFNDIVVYYYIDASDASTISENIPVIRITQDMCSAWGMSVDEVDSLAWENFKKVTPEIMPLYEKINRMAGKHIVDDFPRTKVIMMTTARNVNGASYLMVPEAFRKVEDSIGKRFVILPSSVHELLCVSFSKEAEEDGFSELKAMVKEINSNIVPDNDILTDSIFLYEYGNITEID